MIFSTRIYDSDKWIALSEAESRLSTYYIHRANNKTLELFPSLTKIARDIKMSRNTVVEANKSLIEKGFLSKSRQFNGSNIYKLNINYFGNFYMLKGDTWNVLQDTTEVVSYSTGSTPEIRGWSSTDTGVVLQRDTNREYNSEANRSTGISESDIIAINNRIPASDWKSRNNEYKNLCLAILNRTTLGNNFSKFSSICKEHNKNAAMLAIKLNEFVAELIANAAGPAKAVQQQSYKDDLPSSYEDDLITVTDLFRKAGLDTSGIEAVYFHPFGKALRKLTNDDLKKEDALVAEMYKLDPVTIKERILEVCNG